MRDLIFLPIELRLNRISFNIDAPIFETFKGLWKTQIVPETDPEIRYILNQLPYSKISKIKYNTQSKDVSAHIDIQPGWIDHDEYQHTKENEPAGYRIVLLGKKDTLEIFDGKEWKVAHIPSCPFAYLLNTTDTQHRVLGETGRKTLYFRGFLNVEKHQELIRINLKKYSDYAIYRQ